MRKTFYLNNIFASYILKRSHRRSDMLKRITYSNRKQQQQQYEIALQLQVSLEKFSLSTENNGQYEEKNFKNLIKALDKVFKNYA